MRRRFAIAFWAVLIVASCSGGETRPTILWSFESASISEDGSSIEIDAYRPPDRSCYEFDHVELEPVGDQLVMSLFYLGPGEQVFCNMPCPMGTERLEVSLDEPQKQDVTIVKNPDTEPHCFETLS